MSETQDLRLNNGSMSDYCDQTTGLLLLLLMSDLSVCRKNVELSLLKPSSRKRANGEETHCQM